MADEAGQLELSISIGDASFSASGDTSVVLRAYEDFKPLIAADPSRPPKPRVQREDPPDPPDDKAVKVDHPPKRTTTLPLKPFLEQYNLRTNKEKATAIVAWSAEKGEQAALTVSEIEKLWKKTPFKVPKNLPRDLRDAEDEGWLESEGKAGSPEATFGVNGYGEGILAGWAKGEQKE